MKLRHRRVVQALPGLIASILILSCGSGPERTAADPSLVTSAADGGVPQEARDAIVLLLDAETKCLRVAEQRRLILGSSGSSEERWRELAAYRRGAGERELTIVEHTLDIVERLRSGLEATCPTEVVEPIGVMSKAVKDLCFATEDRFQNLDKAVSNQQKVMRDAEQQLSQLVQVSDAERREIYGRYRSEVRRGGERRPPDLEGLSLEQRYRALESRKVSDVSPSVLRGFESWHGSHWKDLKDLKSAVARFRQLRNDYQLADARVGACADLTRTCDSMLRDPSTFKTPEPDVGQTLRHAADKLKQAGSACLKEDPIMQERNAKDGLEAFDAVSEMLRRYEIEL